MLATRYIRTDFTSQEDFEQNYTLNIPERFNFAYDIVDEYARISPEKPAMVWTNVEGEERRFTFRDMSEKSNQAANFFRTLGLKKGDPVMLVMKRRYEYWFCALALMKLGCVIVPATAQLAKKDVVYRCEAASIRAIISRSRTSACMPSLRSSRQAMASSFSSILVRLSAYSACVRMALSGVRSSCAASEVNCRSCSKAIWSRSSISFIVSASA